LRAPILPTSALEITAGRTVDVLRGQVIAVDDMDTTILDRDGQVHFVRDGEVHTRTICPETAQASSGAVEMRGRPVEDSMLEWVAPTRRVTDVDPRCLGRPLEGG
jgi:hypothetical protein